MIANLLRTETAENHKTLEFLMFVNEIMNNFREKILRKF